MRRTWLCVACGAFALSGFPLDDMWHRVFGQDVTLWGPTHLMLIGGASLATLGSLALLSEAVATLGYDPERTHSRWLVLLLAPAAQTSATAWEVTASASSKRPCRLSATQTM